MLLAAWREVGTAESGLWNAVSTFAAQAPFHVTKAANWLVAVRSPGKLDLSGRGWLYIGRPARHLAEAGGPDIMACDSGLTATIGPLPQRPLYHHWSETDRVFVICSQLDPLVRFLEVRAINHSRLVAHIAGKADSDRSTTPFRNIKRLPPGVRIDVGRHGISSRLEPPTPGDSYIESTAPELAERLKETLADAVARSMEGADRVAVHAGGGLDSSGVLALAVSESRRRGLGEVVPVALDFAGPGDDRPYMRELARHLRVEPTRIRPRDAAPYFLTALCVDAQPGLFSSACLDLFMSKAAVDLGCDVALGGGLGDTVLGPLHGLAALARRGHPLSATMLALRMKLPWTSTAYERVRDLVVFPALRQYVPPRIRTLRQRRTQWASWLTSDAVQMLDRSPPHAVNPIARTPNELLAYRCQMSGIATYADGNGQAASATGCDSVDIFCDIDVVKLVCRINPVLMNYGHEYRGLYRLAMTELLPEGVRTRRDKARFEPAVAEAALGGDGLDVLADLSSVSALSSLGLVDARRLRPVADACIAAVSRGMREGDDLMTDSWEPFWRTLAVERFLRLWGGAGLPPEAAPC
jgi:asparagine synthetase B (glutamine-hydrolysing)